MTRSIAILAVSVVTLSLLLLTKPGQIGVAKAYAQKPEGSSDEDQRKAITIAEQFAKAVANPGSPEYFRALENSLLTLRAKEYPIPSIPSGRVLQSKEGGKPDFAALREKLRAEVADQASIYRDPVWQKNYDKWLQLVKSLEQPLRIFGGVPTEIREFPDCVAVGSASGFCCSGTLIAKDLVVTAAHCVRGGCSDRIFIGNDSNNPSTGRVVKVRKSIAHPEYNQFTLRNDIAILILEAPVDDVTPRKIASSQAIDAAFFVRLVGFGITDFGPFGIQFKVDAAIASTACGTTDAQDRYGCNSMNEIVAGGNGADSCNGDSGGPAYVMDSGQLALAGATSRATKNSVRPCGDGGIYTRVDRYVDWIRTTAAAEGTMFE